MHLTIQKQKVEFMASMLLATSLMYWMIFPTHTRMGHFVCGFCLLSVSTNYGLYLAEHTRNNYGRRLSQIEERKKIYSENIIIDVFLIAGCIATTYFIRVLLEHVEINLWLMHVLACLMLASLFENIGALWRINEIQREITYRR